MHTCIRAYMHICMHPFGCNVIKPFLSTIFIYTHVSRNNMTQYSVTMILYISLCPIASRTTSCHISSHNAAPHRIASHRVASRRVASHRTVSHRIALYRIMSHHIVSHPASTEAFHSCSSRFSEGHVIPSSRVHAEVLTTSRLIQSLLKRDPSMVESG